MIGRQAGRQASWIRDVGERKHQVMETPLLWEGREERKINKKRDGYTILATHENNIIIFTLCETNAGFSFSTLVVFPSRCP